MKNESPSSQNPVLLLTLGWVLLIALAYGRILLDPSLHFACPENDTWNFPIRYSVSQSLNQGLIPLWNSLLAFGIPWLATWQTEVFYPSTLLFNWLGLSAWNFLAIFHLFLFAFGTYLFLRRSGVGILGAFVVGSMTLTNACAFNHIGSNASTYTMAWIPWIFLGVHDTLNARPKGSWLLAAALSLQVLAGYPQILFYTWVTALLYALVLFRSFEKLIFPFFLALALTACQWIPSMEYFFFQSVRLPSIANNPGFTLPFENLLTFLTPHPLAAKGIPDYVASPTYFYFNFYSGPLALALLAIGLYRFKTWDRATCFWFGGFVLLASWTFGAFHWVFSLFHLTLPGFLEPAKAWVLVDFFELITLGFLFRYFTFRQTWYRWLLLPTILFLLIPIWFQPLERNLIPPNSQLDEKAQTLKDHLGSGRVLVLASQEESPKLYTPLPDPQLQPLFKYFVPDTNLYSNLPLADFYGSTWPTWGAMDAGLYFKYGYPFKGRLLDMLGIDLLFLDSNDLPSNFKKVGSLNDWPIWTNPTSVGDHLFFKGVPKTADRKDIFEAFASGSADPRKDLYLEKEPISQSPNYPLNVTSRDHFELKDRSFGFFVVTQNAMPGWHAWIDGHPADLFLANGIFQGIAINPGNKTLDLRYEPTSFRLGLFLSLLALGIFAMIIFVSKT